MSEQNQKAILANRIPKIYQDSHLSALLNVSLPIDSEIEIGEVVGENAVRVILPDSTIGFVHGDEVLYNSTLMDNKRNKSV